MRDTTASQTQSNPTLEDQTADRDGTKSVLERRGFLETVGVGVAAVLGLSGVAAAESARTLDISDGEVVDPYLEEITDGEVVNIPSGTYEFGGATVDANDWTLNGQGCTFEPTGTTSLDLQGDDWSFGGVRFDVPGSKQVKVFPDGNDWRLHSCAWDGEITNVNYLVYPGVGEDRTGEIDRCWFGGGCGENRSESAIKASGACNGTLWIRRSYFYQSGSYTVQTVDPPEMRGAVNFEQCYFENCYLSCLRTGNDYGKTCEVNDCVLLYDSKAETPAVQDRGVKAFRGVWAFWGEVEVTNTDITNPYGSAVTTADDHGNASVTVNGGNIDGGTDGDVTVTETVGSDPSTSPPDGCVTSVEGTVAADTSDTKTFGPES